MKKIAVLFCIMFTFSQSVFSSDNRKVVAVYPFAGDQEIAAVFQEQISNELLKLNRVILVNRKGHSEAQATEAFATANTIGDFGTQMGASRVLKGVVSRANVVDRTNKRPFWEARISLELSVIDVASGRILQSHTFSTTQNATNRKDVLDKAYKNLVDRVIPFLKSGFPIEGRITSVNEVVDPKKGVQVKDLLINLGSIEGIKKKMIFDVFEEIMIVDQGQEKVLENFIGQIRVKEVKGENFSESVISKNHAQMQKILANPENFIVRSPKERVK